MKMKMRNQSMKSFTKSYANNTLLKVTILHTQFVFFFILPMLTNLKISQPKMETYVSCNNITR